MDRRLLGTQRVPSAMEIEHSRQNSSSHLPQTREPNSRFSELQLRRDRRRTSESKFADTRNPQPDQKLCDFCNKLILLSIYDQHIIDCPQKPGNQHMSTDTLMTEDVEGRQGQQEESQSNTMETEENQLQLARPLPDFSIHPSEQAPENFFNLFGRFRNPLSRPEPQQQPQPQEPQAPTTTSSFLSSIFNSIFSPFRQHQRPDNLPLESEQNPTNAPVEGHNQPENEGGLFSQGAIFVRTIQPAPNGTLIVRMRVIPLGNLFGNQEENGEGGNQPPNDGLIGGLISMLLGLHGHGLFEEEQGLEKEALDSLPVVSYHTEQFKHVDDEYKSCPICLDCFEEDHEVRFLWCLHRFHKNCVDQWLDKHTTCPICKKDYSEAVKNCEEVCEEPSKESS